MGRMLTHPKGARLAALCLITTIATASTLAQTPVKRDNNRYTAAQDVEIGQEAAAEVRRELPMLNDPRVDDYVEGVGRNLVRAIPPEFQEPAFRYTFEGVNQKEINAFALPGGPMFLHRGMIEAAKTEGEMAGVMAHEIAHVALRHGTAQATKGQKFQIGAIAGQILGAIVGGAAGSVIAQGSSFGLGAYFLKYGREYEREADVLGARIMAEAGYDPRDMAEMFRTIENESGAGGPEWLSSHPNPGNRYNAIQKEAAMLQVRGTPRSPAEFNAIKSRLRAMPPAYTAEQIARAKANGRRLPDTAGGGNDEGDIRAGNARVEPPSTQYQQVQVGNFLRLQVPSNWRRVSGKESVTFAPEGAQYRGDSGRSGFTHGMQLGVIPNESHSHQEATDELLASLQQGNPQIRRQNSGYVRESIGGRTALSTTLRNVSEVTGEAEIVAISTVPLRDGSLLYLIGVVPQDETDVYGAVFRRIKQTMQISDRQISQR
jgi:hypothetical protein